MFYDREKLNGKIKTECERRMEINESFVFVWCFDNSPEI